MPTNDDIFRVFEEIFGGVLGLNRPQFFIVPYIEPPETQYLVCSTTRDAVTSASVECHVLSVIDIKHSLDDAMHRATELKELVDEKLKAQEKEQ